MDEEERKDLDEFLAQTYEHLSRHQKSLNEVDQSTMTLVAALTELVPGFQAVYRKHYEDAGRKLQERQSDSIFRLYDEIIRRLRYNG
jgi:hypothetical protein